MAPAVEATRVKEDLVKAANAVRAKVNALKRGEEERATGIEKTFQPVTEPLRELVNLKKDSIKLKRGTAATKSEIPRFRTDATFFEDDLNDFALPTPVTHSSTIARQPRTLTGTSLPPGAEDEDLEDDVFTTSPQQQQPKALLEAASRPSFRDEVLYKARRSLGPLSQNYVAEMILDVADKFDHRFGFRLDPATGGFKIGNENAEIDVDDAILIGEKKYNGTPGLYELLFKKWPRRELIIDDDVEQYKDILTRTNAHKQRFDPRLNLASSSSYKYNTYIAPLFGAAKKKKRRRFTDTPGPSGRSASVRGRHQTAPTGEGLVKLSDNNIDYVHYNDPNELVERLVLLKGSQVAGHRGHDLEIASIEEELREWKIIA